MKTNTIHTYACEICGRTYFDEADALKCEEKCNKKKLETEARDRDDETIKQAFYILKDMAKKYCEKYHKLPTILAMPADKLEDKPDEPDEEEDITGIEEETKECDCKHDECDCQYNAAASSCKKPFGTTYVYKVNPIEELLREFKIF